MLDSALIVRQSEEGPFLPMTSRKDSVITGKVVFWLGAFLAVLGIVGLIIVPFTSGTVRLGVTVAGGGSAFIGLALMLFGHFTQKQEKIERQLQNLRDEDTNASKALEAKNKAEAVEKVRAELLAKGAIVITEEQLLANQIVNNQNGNETNRGKYQRHSIIPPAPALPKKGESVEIVWMYDQKQNLSFAVSQKFYQGSFSQGYDCTNGGELYASWDNLVPIEATLHNNNGTLYLELGNVGVKLYNGLQKPEKARDSIKTNLCNPDIKWT